MSRSTENTTVRKRGLIVVLLAASCMVSAYLLWTTEPRPPYRLTSPAQLDSLITDSLGELQIPDTQVRIQNIRIDSSFTRKRYIVRVDPAFSKTSFHYNLHERVWPYHARTIGNVQFPERNLQIHIAHNGTIHRTIYLYTPSQN